MREGEMEYSNPRMSATFHDWPYGTHRTTCTFEIERSGRGERCVRITVNPKTHLETAPKALTYAVAQRIVDGDDGKTYIICKSIYGTISVMQSNMQLQQESIAPEDGRFAALNAMFSREQS